MKKLRLTDLACGGNGHILNGIIPGRHLSRGGLSFKQPGERSHDRGCACPSCDGQGRHVHTGDSEVFILLEGKARMEIDGQPHKLAVGDVIVCEPGEDHHLVSDEHEPCVIIWLHAGESRHTDH
jgi:mannose-6-phosphate isomerase-like protein (cupin superfamily)